MRLNNKTNMNLYDTINILKNEGILNAKNEEEAYESCI